jgi:phosphate:Na+ symporter
VSGFELLIDICGGVALLLWATRMVRTGIERAYGPALRNFLGYASRNRLAAFGTGLGTAAALQSSTATALLAISFAGSQLLQTAPGLAVMLGADLGSTLVVQALSFDIGWLAPALLLLGVALFLTTRGRKSRQLGRIVIGLGLMLLALELIVEASAPLRDSQALRVTIGALGDDPLLALMLGAMLTWLAHSSVAMVLLIMSLVNVGLVPMALGFVLVLGANVGSGLIPLVLTLGREPPLRRIPLGNLLFRLVGALLALLLVPLAVDQFAAISTTPARQIANFHTLFNLALGLLFLPLTGLLARGLDQWLTPRPPLESGTAFTAPSQLDAEVVDKPAQALACATREVLRMAERVETMLRHAIDMFATDDKKTVAQLARLDDDIDRMNNAIKLYLTRVSRNQLDDHDSRRCMEITTFTIKLEQIGDIIEKNLLELARKKIGKRLDFSNEGWGELTDMHGQVVDNMRLALNVFLSGDPDSARQLIEHKEQFGALERKSSARHLARLRAGQVASIETSAIHLDILHDLKQINSHLASVAYPILHQSGELHRSRLKSPVDDGMTTEG